MSALNQTLITFALILFVGVMSMVAVALFQFIRLKMKQLESDQRYTQLQAIGNIAKSAVAAAEQAGMVDNLIGPEKKQHALDVAEGFLRQQGIAVDLDQIASVIEAEVYNQGAAASTPPPAAATGADEHAMVSNAIQTAVLAAEQSGLKGLIQNVGTEKKEYAISLATEFLGANGINVDRQVLDGLIEGELMKLFLAARGQMPPGAK